MNNGYAQRLTAIFEKCEREESFDSIISLDRLRISRSKIRSLCDFPRSTIYQNAKVVEIIANKEIELLSRGIILAKRSNVATVDEAELEGELTSRLDVLHQALVELQAELNGVNVALSGALDAD